MPVPYSATPTCAILIHPFKSNSPPITVLWTMRVQAAGRRRGAGAGGGVLDIWVPLGECTVTLELGSRKFTQQGRITKMRGWSLGPPAPQIIK